MTLDEFKNRYPNRPFTLRYVARGPDGERAMGFLLMWTGDYFTSDTDRLCDYPPLPNRDDVRYLRGWGTTVEAAIEALLEAEIAEAAGTAKGLAEAQHKAEAKLAELRKGRTP